MMRERERTKAEARPGQLAWPNGSEVYAKDSKRLKGYIVNHAPGKNQCEAFTAKGESLGTGTQGECFTLLDTPRAVRAASEVFIETAPKRRRG